MKKNYDLIVVGGGVGGCSASLTARRNGLKVLLIEKSFVLGGLATQGLINWYEPLCNKKGKQMIFSVAEEFLRLSIKFGGKVHDEKWLNSSCGDGWYAGYFNHNAFSMQLTKLLDDEGVDISFDTLLTGVDIENGLVKSVKVETVEGQKTIGCKALIDSSGTAIACYLAGLPTETGENYFSFVTQLQENKWEFTGSDMTGNGHPEDMKTFNGASLEDINRYTVAIHKNYIDLMEQGKKGKGLAQIPTMAQFRMIRRLVGEKTLTTQDKLTNFESSVGLFGYFFKAGEWFTLPYECLYNKKVDNLLTAGRIISASGEGWDATRVIPVAVQTGEISAEAVSLMIKEGNTASTLSVKKLQEKLKEKGFLLYN